MVVFRVQWLGPKNDESLTRTHNEVVYHIQIHLTEMRSYKANIRASRLHVFYLQHVVVSPREEL